MGIVVLGMHRSGTSLLIGLLQEFGYSLGTVSNLKSVLKPTGTKENIDLRNINNQILNFNQLSWKRPSTDLKYSTAIKNKLISFANELPKSMWAIKDPRLILSYNIWCKYLPAHKVISTIRHPLLVAQSLKIKNNINSDEAVKIWQLYNQALLDHWKQKQFPILNFDIDPNTYFNQIKILQPYLKIKIEFDGFNKFYQHKYVAPKNIGLQNLPEVEKLYSRLLEISTNNHTYE